MCQQIVQFCSGSTKPLFYIGASLTLLASAAIAYAVYDNQSLIASLEADEGGLMYYLEYLVSLYLVLIALLACYAAHFDQKHSKGALAVLTSINVVLFAAAALIALTSGQEVGSKFKDKLADARNSYNYSDPPIVEQQSQDTNDQTSPVALNLTVRNLAARSATAAADGQEQSKKLKPLTASEATKIWDNLQQRGCCGFDEWEEWTKDKLPKSCCSSKNQTKTAGNLYRCPEVDEAHKQPCIKIIESKNMQLRLVVVIVALVNLYLAVVASFSTYRTLHYNEASQSAYT